MSAASGYMAPCSAALDVVYRSLCNTMVARDSVACLAICQTLADDRNISFGHFRVPVPASSSDAPLFPRVIFVFKLRSGKQVCRIAAWRIIAGMTYEYARLADLISRQNQVVVELICQPMGSCFLSVPLHCSVPIWGAAFNPLPTLIWVSDGYASPKVSRSAFPHYAYPRPDHHRLNYTNNIAYSQ